MSIEKDMIVPYDYTPLYSRSLILSTNISYIGRESIDDYNKNVRIWMLAACLVNFENQYYTIITSQCKGPDYDPNPCCYAFIEFACPFADYLNNLTNDYSTVMFSYINANGKYPLGLFVNLCRQGKEGLACLAPPPSDSDLLDK